MKKLERLKGNFRYLVIVHLNPKTRRRQYWNNDTGWVTNKKYASRFTLGEKDVYKLPDEYEGRVIWKGVNR